jgi:hypothetical protein
MNAVHASKLIQFNQVKDYTNRKPMQAWPPKLWLKNHAKFCWGMICPGLRKK